MTNSLPPLIELNGRISPIQLSELIPRVAFQAAVVGIVESRVSLQPLIRVTRPQSALAGVLAPEPASQAIPALAFEVSHHRGAVSKIPMGNGAEIVAQIRSDYLPIALMDRRAYTLHRLVRPSRGPNSIGLRMKIRLPDGPQHPV